MEACPVSLLFREKRDLAALEIAYARTGWLTKSGVPVTEETAERHSAVWACRAAIAEALQQLPVEEVRNKAGQTVHQTPPAVFYDPAPGWTWEQWIWSQAWAMSGQGKCYAYVATVSASGWPTSLVPIDPCEVVWTWVRRDKRWKITVGGEEEVRWPLGRLWHCPLYVTAECPEGMSPIRYHAETIGVGLAAQQFGAQFFGDGGHPTMVVTAEKDPGDNGAKILKQKVMDALRGNREPIVIGGGTKLEQWQVAPNESQFLETMRYSGEDVARVFGVPPEKIGLSVSGSNVTYSNVADRNSDWRVSGLSRYVMPFESALSRLVPAGTSRTIRFNFNAFLRADLTKRFEAYKVAAEVGDIAGTPLLQVNEMRNEEGLPPLPGGDTFTRKTTPAQTTTRSTDQQLELALEGGADAS
jgi:HK97 family phage portal protein